jgi:hypothetical protein
MSTSDRTPVDETPLFEKTVMRRGLIAGLASLGAAALLKVSGAAKKAEAATTPILYPTLAGDGPITNTFANTTSLKAAANQFGTATGFKVDVSGGQLGSIDAIRGIANGASGLGGWFTGGDGAAGSGYGVYAAGGFTSGSNTRSAGVRGLGGQASSGPGGAGVQGDGGSSSTGPTGIGVRGASVNNTGVYGVSDYATGVHGHSGTNVGLRGTSAQFVGLVGISNTNIGLYGYTTAPNVAAFYAENLAPSGKRVAGFFNGDVQIQGNFTVLPGYAKNAAVSMPDGTDAVLYCQESPEPYFEDFGRAKLTNGRAHVQIEPEFASIIKRDDYMVFVTPNGEVKNPLIVTSQSGNAFEVYEANNGRSDAPFTYRIVARRKDIQGKRLERLDPKLKQNLATMRANAASKASATLRAQTSETPLVPMEPIPAELPEVPKKN